MTALAISPDDPITGTDFMVEMVRQMRALDTFGFQDNLAAGQVLAAFVLTKEDRKLIPIVGDPDAGTMARLNAFYNAIASMIEKECGLMAVPLVHLSNEGFGRALITVGKLVVMDRTLRDVHRFGFDSLSKMKDEADKLLAVALEIIGHNSEVAGM